jgi:hypothetical protein
VDDSMAIFDNHRVEIASYIVLSHMFQREFPGLPAHDGKDPRGIR